MADLIERLTIDIITEDCGGTYSALDHIYEWVEVHGNGQTIINSKSVKLKLVEDK
jgi:hypothetical protein|tara:strand:+ start:762 stop:926 length:165 start_codon:yes stop_codon:yes gene_type:complete